MLKSNETFICNYKKEPELSSLCGLVYKSNKNQKFSRAHLIEIRRHWIVDNIWWNTTLPSTEEENSLIKNHLCFKKFIDGWW